MLAVVGKVFHEARQLIEKEQEIKKEILAKQKQLDDEAKAETVIDYTDAEGENGVETDIG